jgi:hypothetical protein
MGLSEDDINQIRYSEKYINSRGIKNMSKYKNTTYNESKDLKIRNVAIFYVQLFGRKYVLLGEIHQHRHSEDLINYSNLIKMPIKMAKTKRKCIDVYIENAISEKPILSNNTYEIFTNINTKKNATSLSKLLRDLFITESYQKHKYYRLHNFDTREYARNNSGALMTKIFDLFLDMSHDGFNFDDFLIEIFTASTRRQIMDTVYNLIISYSTFIEESDNKKYENINSGNKADRYIQKKYKINIAYMTKYLYNLVIRINKEYGKIPYKFKEIDISPVRIITSLKHKDLFMTDLYLFYRLLMDFNTTGRNTGRCESYSNISFILGGLNHIENIEELLNIFYHGQMKDFKFYRSMSINEYERFLNDKIFD